MPKIRSGEKSKDYVNRCIHYLIKKEGKTRDRAAGQCYGMLRQARGKGAAPKERGVRSKNGKKGKT